MKNKNPVATRHPVGSLWLRTHLGGQVCVRLLDGHEYSGRLTRYDLSTIELILSPDDTSVMVHRRAIAAAHDSESLGYDGHHVRPLAAPVVAPSPETVPISEPEPSPEAPASLGDLVARWSSTYPQLFDAFLLFLVTLIVYRWSNRGVPPVFNQDVLLANALLHGHLDLIRPAPWLEVVPWHGRFYAIDPPMPGILLMPFVALFGTFFSQAALSILVGALDVALAYIVLFKLFHRRAVAIWVSLLYAFGTVQWYHAENGSSWYLASPVALLFLWLALLELLTRQRLFLVGLLIGCAYLAREPMILAAVFVLVYCWDRFVPRRGPSGAFHFQKIVPSYLWFGSGLAILLALGGLYTYACFGSPLRVTYDLAPGNHSPSLFPYGWMSVRYIPIHLQEMFTALPAFRSTWPYVVPSIFVMAVWFTTPAFVLAVFAPLRSRLTIACLAAIAAIAIPILTFGANGETQFGYRYTLDFTPFLLILVAAAIGSRINWADKSLIALSVAVNLWGVLMLTFFGLFVF